MWYFSQFHIIMDTNAAVYGRFVYTTYRFVYCVNTDRQQKPVVSFHLSVQNEQNFSAQSLTLGRRLSAHIYTSTCPIQTYAQIIIIIRTSAILHRWRWCYMVRKYSMGLRHEL